ncbi:PRC-barrel domain-containing protein [Ancylobacter sp. IITR112]|uniref:PRC-barrel domain-containing protein n=1 Tax=Ancylobacter sp. IITR112 TaxID=3138073 RepID=UPI00352ACF45
MKNRNLLHAAAATSILSLIAGGAVAQTAPSATNTRQAPAASQQDRQTTAGARASGERQVAQQCLDELRAFNAQMNDDGFWISGWGAQDIQAGGRAGMDGATSGTASSGQATRAQRASEDVPANQSPTARAPNTQDNAVTPARSAWGGSSWGIGSPPYQIRTLRSAANVLGQRGEQQACNAVLAEMKEAYRDYTGQLRQAGVEPGDVTSWRQQRLVGARPVTEIDAGLVNLADITGTEVRNLQDEQLGTVEDVVLDSERGGIRYVIVSSGGVLGIGEDMVAVPWQALRATRGLNTFVLNAPSDALDEAPSVDPEAFADPNGSRETRQQVDRFWHDQMSG